MAMPNRSKEVKAIAARYPQTFGPPDNSIDKRRRLLMPIIVKELNELDNDNWFLLNRMDRNDDDPRPGRLTSDVIVWGPTKEHVDVLSGSGAMWGPHGPITDKDWLLETWDKWPSWDTQNPPVPPVDPPPVPPTPTPIPVDIVLMLTKRITQLESEVSSLDGIMLQLGAQIVELQDRIIALENKPAPSVELPKLIAVGNTGRAFGHGHTVELEVVKA